MNKQSIDVHPLELLDACKASFETDKKLRKIVVVMFTEDPFDQTIRMAGCLHSEAVTALSMAGHLLLDANGSDTFPTDKDGQRVDES